MEVHTRFCGVHWTHACLAAIATGVGLGIPLADAAAALADVEPWSGRLEPVEAGGVTFLRDEYKASLWSIGPSLELLRSARAPRKIAVIGTISDYGRQRLGGLRLRGAPGARRGRRGDLRRTRRPSAAPPPGPTPRGRSLHAFLTRARRTGTSPTPCCRATWCCSKAPSGPTICCAWCWRGTAGSRCWRTDCRRITFCDECVLLRVPELPWPATERAAPRESRPTRRCPTG